MLNLSKSSKTLTPSELLIPPRDTHALFWGQQYCNNSLLITKGVGVGSLRFYFYGTWCFTLKKKINLIWTWTKSFHVFQDQKTQIAASVNWPIFSMVGGWYSKGFWAKWGCYLKVVMWHWCSHWDYSFFSFILNWIIKRIGYQSGASMILIINTS